MISENDQLYDLIRATQLRLRKVSPFFAALSLFSKERRKRKERKRREREKRKEKREKREKRKET